MIKDDYDKITCELFKIIDKFVLKEITIEEAQRQIKMCRLNEDPKQTKFNVKEGKE